MRTLDGNLDVVDAAITEMLASSKKPVLYRHIHWKNREVYCLHLPILILRK